MKTGIHPELYDVVFVDISTGAQFITKSTAKSEETVKIDGKEYFVIKVEISSDSHPFYTGKQKILDTAGRVEKFMAKRKAAQEKAAAKVKTVDEEDAEEVAKESTKKADKAEKAEKKEEKPEEKAEAPATPEETEAAEATPETEEPPATEEDKAPESPEAPEAEQPATEEK